MFEIDKIGGFNTLSKEEDTIFFLKLALKFKTCSLEVKCLVISKIALLLFSYMYVVYRYKFKINVAFLNSFDSIIYGHFESVYFNCHESFCQEMVI